MRIKSIKFSLLFCLFFSVVISITQTEDLTMGAFDSTSHQVKFNLTNAFKLQKYKIYFDNFNEFPDYIRIRVASPEIDIK